MKPMQIGLAIAGIIIVAGAAWYFAMQGATPTPNVTPTSEATPSGAQGAGSTNLSSGSADADLDADLNQVDTQMQGASNDSASVNQSLNDQPVQQSE